MSRTLAFGLTALTACALAHIPSSHLAAQGRQGQQTRRERPKGGMAQQVDPNLMRVLTNWYRGTSQIKTLEGNHYQFVYDEVFGTEKRAVGRFYYTAPDKGRIDIMPARLKRGAKANRRAKKGGRLFKLQVGEYEKWICNGSEIAKINPQTKKGEKFNIPTQAQGRNIMHGPLPFLLGMPPNIALSRYHLQVVPGKETPTTVWLKVKPKWKQDLQQYAEAIVILQKDNHYLPTAVKMVDTTGNLETVYTFEDLNVNKPWIVKLFSKDPFRLPTDVKYETPGGRHANNQNKQPIRRGNGIRSRGIAKVPGRNTNEKRTAQVPDNVPRIPDFRKYKSKDVGAWLKKKGYEVVFVKGSVTTNKKMLYVVEDQHPAPNTPSKNVRKVYLKVYVSAKDLKPRRTTAAKP